MLFSPRFAWGALAVLLTVLIPLARADEDEKKSEPVKIKKVIKVEVSKKDGALVITATGEVPTGGYSSPKLERVTYVKMPDDGIQDFTFVATPPDGPATQVISRVEARTRWSDVPDWVKGVRIHGVGEGVMVKMLEEKE